ncbi:MAG: HAMP domain-containing histidine kinase [Deltaproteobacteria bacterium]|nr:HAMP domain-containing histidine kinase [Deltaproteobacteria bacterium]
MKVNNNLEIASYPEQIFVFRKNIFLLRALFYLVLTFFVALPIFEQRSPSVVIVICLALFLLNTGSRYIFTYSKDLEIIIHIQQLINLLGIILLVLYSWGSNSTFVVLFIIEGFFCGLMYNLSCMIGFLAIVICFLLYLCLDNNCANYTTVLSIVLSMFSTISSFLIIREQDKRKIELISYYLKLEKLNSRLIGIGRLRKNFMDIAYHDMRSPLSTVIGFIQNILSGYGGPVTPKQEEWLNRCVDKLNSLSKQINELYFLANIESTDFNEIKKRCDISHEIELAIAEVYDKFVKKNQKFTKNIPNSIPWMVVVPILFRQCIVNLLENANKYTPMEGTIQLEVEYDENWLTVKVSDTGIGIPDEFKPKVFDEFFRVKNTIVDNQKVSGTGLGLTIVKSIVDGHGGTITIQDNKPNGTIFIVKFPVVREYREA